MKGGTYSKTSKNRLFEIHDNSSLERKGPIDLWLILLLHLLGKFTDISYIEEQPTLRWITDVWTLYAGALVCNNVLHMLPYQIKKKVK